MHPYRLVIRLTDGSIVHEPMSTIPDLEAEMENIKKAAEKGEVHRVHVYSEDVWHDVWISGRSVVCYYPEGYVDEINCWKPLNHGIGA